MDEQVKQLGGVTYEPVFWCDIYRGSMEALVAAGLARADQFPGTPGRGKVGVTYYRDQQMTKGQRAKKDEGYLQISRLNLREYQVNKGIPENEQRRREAERQQDARCRTEAERRQKVERRAAAELDCMPRSHAEYRAEVARRIGAVIKAMRPDLMPHEFHGYSYDEDTLRDFDAAAYDLLQVLLDGGTRFNAKRHADRVAAIRAQVAKVDAPLQRFLSTIAQDAEHSSKAEG